MRIILDVPPPCKQAAGLSAVQTMEERFAYELNPQNLRAVSSHLCDLATAAAEFLLVKSGYQAATARPVERCSSRYGRRSRPAR